MLATIVLLGLTCGYEDATKCDPSFDKTFVTHNAQEFKEAGKQCLSLVEKLPDVETVSMLKFRYYGCFTVDYTAKSGYAYLQNMVDRDDNAMYPISKLEVK